MDGTSKTKEIHKNWYFSLDGSSHQTGDAAFNPATPHDLLTALESQHRLTKLTQHATHESKTNTLGFMQTDN
jgi:hypothetical protein